jgi:CRISPR-associated protein (TIGR02584 family)
MENVLQPHLYPRRILLAVTGLSPQILTETVYALAIAGDPAFIPDEVHLITTANGAEYARHTLLDSGMGRFSELLRDYELSGRIRFDADCIHLITGGDGQPLHDIQTPEDNILAADAITELVRHFTLDEEAALHVSIAGGRKTMGFFMGYALSLYGREQDRLSHVLVTAPFESNHDFYFPPAQPRVLFDRNNKPIHTSDAHITLAEIPFVRLRQAHAPIAQDSRAGFSQAVAVAQAQLAPPELRVDLAAQNLTCAGQPVHLEPAVFAYYAWLAKRLKTGAGPVRYDNAEAVAEYLEVYAQVLGDPTSARLENAREVLDRRMNLPASQRKTAIRKYFDPLKAKVNAALEKQLGGNVAQPYRVRTTGARMETRVLIGAENLSVRMIRSTNQES